MTCSPLPPVSFGQLRRPSVFSMPRRSRAVSVTKSHPITSPGSRSRRDGPHTRYHRPSRSTNATRPRPFRQDRAGLSSHRPRPAPLHHLHAFRDGFDGRRPGCPAAALCDRKSRPVCDGRVYEAGARGLERRFPDFFPVGTQLILRRWDSVRQKLKDVLARHAAA